MDATDSAGHCTIVDAVPGHLYSIWMQGSPITGSGDVRPPMAYQPIILRVTGRQVPAPAGHGGGTAPAITGRALTSSGEYIPRIAVCAADGDYEAGVTCVQADAQGNYSVQGCCDIRVMGYLEDADKTLVNGSVRHALTGVPATIVVQVGADTPTGTPSPSAPPASQATAAPTARVVTPVLAQTGGGPALMLLLLGLLLLGSGLVFARSR
jgi:hypothetical protein